MKKLDSETVFEIKKELKKGAKNKELAKKYNISESTVSRIKNGFYYTTICLPSEEYSKGYLDGYSKGFQDAKNNSK